jgi:regulator of replication initiation timing
MEAEIIQLKKSMAQLQEEKLRLKTSYVRLELEMSKAMQGEFQGSGSGNGSKGTNMVLALRKKLAQSERALADKAQEVEALKQDARVAKASELEREKAVLLSEVKRLMQAASTMARSVADANSTLTSLPEQAALSSQNKTLQQECSQLKKHLQEVIAERDKAVADNVRIVSDSRSMMASAVEKALAAREKLVTGDGISARSAAQIRIDDLEKTNRRLQADFDHAKEDHKKSGAEVQRLKIRIHHLESLIASSVASPAASAVSFPGPSAKAPAPASAVNSKPVASPSTLQQLSFNCKHYSKSFLRTVVQVPFAISWPEFLKRLRDEFPGACGCTYVHSDSVAVISNFRQFEQACERIEDAFIAGSGDGSLDILVIFIS